MKFTSSIHQQFGIVRLEGRFTFDSHVAFRASTRVLLETPGLQGIILDLEKVTHMDASSMGAVLLLREAALPRLTLALRRPSSNVRSLLKIIQFDQLFEILP